MCASKICHLDCTSFIFVLHSVYAFNLTERFMQQEFKQSVGETSWCIQVNWRSPAGRINKNRSKQLISSGNSSLHSAWEWLLLHSMFPLQIPLTLPVSSVCPYMNACLCQCMLAGNYHVWMGYLCKFVAGDQTVCLGQISISVHRLMFLCLQHMQV